MKSFMLIATLALSVLPMANASATGQQQKDNRNAINTCTVPFDNGVYNAVRKRPMAIVNEGTIPAFVNCGFSQITNSYGTEEFSVWLTSYRNTPVQIFCTGTVGVDRKPNQRIYIVKSATLPANGSVNIKWTYQADNGGKRWNDNKDSNQVDQNLGFQCVLPVNTGVGDMPTTYRIN